MSKQVIKPAGFTKNKKKRYYVFSELVTSNNLPSELKDLLEREKTSYRHTVPTEVIPLKLKKHLQEVVESTRKVMIMNKEGEPEEKELAFSSFDRGGHRYYLEPKKLGDLEAFVEKLGVGVELGCFNEEEEDDEEKEPWLEENLGIPLPESPFMTLHVLDSVFLDHEDCPECGGEREEDE